MSTAGDENDSESEYDHLEQYEINNLITSVLNKIKMSSNNIASINNLINNEEDEDRKFLRAAAEAIVATSMDNQIDPTILELLRRIQYANVPGSINPNTGTSAYTRDSNSGGNGSSTNKFTSTTTTPISSNNLNSATSATAAGTNPLDSNHSESNGINPYSSHQNTLSNPINFLDTASNINPAKNSHHFPTFNLNYFDSLQKPQSTNNNNTAVQQLNEFDQNSNSSWSINGTQQTPTPNSQISTPPSTSALSHHQQQQGSSSSSSRTHDSKPFLCSDCSLSFRRSSDLRRHQRAHLPILPHICKMCGKGFARKDALKRHSDTLTCKRNREKLLSSGGDVESILAEAKKQGHDV